MSVFAVGQFRYRQVNRDGEPIWLVQCPKCETWCTLDADQWAGKVSVFHDEYFCGYHETHDFAADLVTAQDKGILVGFTDRELADLAATTPADDDDRYVEGIET